MRYTKEQIEELIKRLDKEINKTPTGELRNLLADANICLRFLNIETNCTCKDSTGWTEKPCCNICGKQVEGKQ